MDGQCGDMNNDPFIPLPLTIPFPLASPFFFTSPVIDLEDNESDEGDTDDCLFDGEPDGEIGDLIDPFDSAGFEHILSETENN